MSKEIKIAIDENNDWSVHSEELEAEEVVFWLDVAKTHIIMDLFDKES